ncbi:programmed cell death 6-interacting protein isoform X1 [Lethenteron reissneri]|uniref:programmed cell death 6-interacting protein isoform X1 n=1 Tax=Lethenteron reissneri TaxID=7753 RepID=UPI002AB769FF|nr:programmed cell death 6-interacting protein isoform X1 [Lethenteron reissneri]
MATFVTVPLKKSYELDVAKPLSRFILDTYGPGHDFAKSLEELNALRRSAACRPLDKHEASLDLLERYYDQLCAIEPKLPINEGQNPINFTWRDAFDKGSLFGGSAKLTIPRASYEKICVLFNIGALMSQIAGELNLDSDDGMKTAAKYYQQASGCFLQIKESVLSALNREPTVDISPDTVGALSVIMLAQAQEVFYMKASADKMKDVIVAKLGNQAADYYGDAFKQCQYKEQLPKYFYFQEVLPLLAAKHCIYQATAQLHQSNVAKQQKKFGEEIARLQHATDLVKTVTSRYDEYISVKDLSDKISRALTAAKKDNDFIYHDRVPDIKDLEAIGKATLVKPLQLTSPMSPRFVDLFEKMVPLAVNNAVTAYNQRKADLVNRSVMQMREATTLLNGILASLNLPAALEDLSGDTVPPSILEKSVAIVEKGGLDKIDYWMKNLPEFLQRNREILNEAMKMLSEEEVTDNDLRTKFQQKWQRTPSNDLYKPLRAEGDKYRQLIDNAVNADGVVKQKYNEHRDYIAMLSQPQQELNSAIPSANPAASLAGSETVQILRSLLSDLDTVKGEREALEGELRAVDSDMTGRFLGALAQDGALNEEDLSRTELERLYGPYTQRVTESIRRQEELLRDLQVRHQEFAQQKQASTESNLRDEVLRKLAAAHDGFMQLLGNLEEGNKFYGDLTEILLKFQSKCNDIVFARKTERDELLKDIQQKIAKEPSAPVLGVPAYQQSTEMPPQPLPRTTAPSKPQAPPRPPPPVLQPTPSAAPAPAPVAAASTPSTVSMAQGPPFASYPGYPGAVPMPMGFNPYTTYTQYAMPPYGAQPQPGQAYPQGQPQYVQPQMPGYPQGQMPTYTHPYGYPQQPYPYQQAYNPNNPNPYSQQ